MTIPNRERTMYLGDSVYLTNNLAETGYLEIFTYNGGFRENIIYLEPYVAHSLLAHVATALIPTPEPKSDVDI